MQREEKRFFSLPVNRVATTVSQITGKITDCYQALGLIIFIHLAPELAFLPYTINLLEIIFPFKLLWLAVYVLSFRCHEDDPEFLCSDVICNISNTRKRVSSDIQTLRSRLHDFEVFGYLMKRTFECLIWLLN